VAFEGGGRWQRAVTTSLLPAMEKLKIATAKEVDIAESGRPDAG